MRALLDMMRDNEAAVQVLAAACQELLEHASLFLNILDPKVGEKELIKAVAAAAAKLLALIRYSTPLGPYSSLMPRDL